MKDTITYLIQQGSKLNFTAFMKPISYFHQDYEFRHSNTEYFDDEKNSGQKSYTPLIIAVLFRMKEIIKQMVEKGADINFTDNFGDDFTNYFAILFAIRHVFANPPECHILASYQMWFAKNC